MEIKFEITEQDYIDIQTVIDGLFEGSEYIEMIIGKSNLEEHHHHIIDNIGGAIDFLKKIKPINK